MQWSYNYHREFDQVRGLVGPIEGTVGNEVAVRFGEVVVEVSPEPHELAEE